MQGFSHCCYTMPDKKQLKGDSVPLGRKGMASERVACAHMRVLPGSRDSVHLLLIIQSRSLAPGMAPPAVKVLSTSVTLT